MYTRKVKIFTLLILLTLIIPAHPVSAAGYCDWAQFVSDVSVPDGSAFNGGTAFTKTWRLKNIGSCTWTTAYSLVFSSGEQMGGPVSVNLPYNVGPGQTVELSVTLTAPINPGSYRGFWKFRNPSGALFGIGAAADGAIWVDIQVNTATAILYDFSADACSATWHYDGGPIPCPYKESQSRYGAVFRLDNPTLESGLPAGQPALLVIPHQKYNGVIQGVFPKVEILRGDRFQADIGCEYGATNCYVTFQLDYLTPTGEVVTFWKFREKYDGRMSRVDLDLSKLYWKKNIKLILTVSASGSATGDRALWIKPVLVRPMQSQVITSTPVPVVTPATLTPIVNINCDRAVYVTDVSVPDNTSFAPGAGFIKTWRLQNSGTCTWITGYSLVYFSGEKMSGQDSIALPASVAPNQTVDVSVNFTAPMTAGNYQGFWMLRNVSGQTFGIGPNADSPIWVKINVAGTPVTPVSGSGYDFVENVCSAQWYSNGGLQPCPGTDGNTLGFVLKQTGPRVETGATDTRPGLLTVPQNASNGYLQGIYPAFTVQSGDRFQSTISCEFNATDCFAVYRLDYQIGTGPIFSYWTYAERYDGQTSNVDIDLSLFAGQNVKFILTVLSNGSASGDRTLWVAPRITRFAIGGGLEPAIAVPTGTETPTPTIPSPIDTETPTPTITETPTPAFTETPTPTLTITP